MGANKVSVGINTSANTSILTKSDFKKPINLLINVIL